MSVLTLNVDEVMRTLSNDGQYPFVVNDKTVDIVRFALNTGFTDVVLDEYSALRVMYQRPGETEVRAQTLTYYDTDGLHNYYDWQLLSADLAEKGTITVALCILRADGDVEEWHTTPCQIRVLDTIHTDDSDEGDETITPTVAQRVAVLESLIQSIAGSAPVAVSDTADMTDTAKIYVLTTNSKWYYYTGSEWAAGGTYGSAGTDKTLSVSGAPADAKVTGDAVRNVANAVNNIDRRVDNIIGQTGDSNTEIVDARQDAVGVVHNTLRSRLLTDYRNITNSPNNTYLFAERVLQYDYPYEHTLNGFCCDDDYFYVTSVARNTIPADFQKTKILKFSRSTYELVAEIEGDYGHANSLTVDRANHVLYSAKCFYYEVDGNDVVQSMRSNDINVFDVSGSSITYVKTISTDYRSGSVAFWSDTLYMYYEEGAIFAIDTETGAATPYCTLSDTGTGTAQQSIDIDDKFIYRLTSTDSSIAYSGGILVYDHEGNFINRVAISNGYRIGFVDELEDLTVEDGVAYVASCQTDRSEPAPYNNMRNVLVQKIYLTNALPNLNVLDGRFLANNPSYRAPINVYVDCNTTKYKADGTSAYPFKKIRDALFYMQFCDKGKYFISVKGGRYSETLKFVNMAGVDVRIQRWGSDAVILDKPITMFDGVIEFRQITFDVTNNPRGTLVCDASWNSEPLRLSLRNCNFIADELITGTHYGIYNSKIFGATIHIVSDTYDANASGIIHYAPYCRTELWQRPNDRVNKDIFRVNNGSLIHSRVSLSGDASIDGIFNPGIYMIVGNSGSELPSGSNGWLIVLSQPLYGDAYNTLTKQIFFRMGTAGKTDNHVFHRTYGGGVWGQWYEFAFKEGSMPSGTTVTFGYGNFTGYTTSSKRELAFIIPLNFEVPANLTNVRFVTANITVRNNGVSVSSIGLEDTSKITSYTIERVNGIGVKAVLNFNTDFVNNNFGSMLNNNVVNVFFQSLNSGLVFTDPNAQPDTPDVPDDEGEDPVDNNSEGGSS